jgi:ceramide glucosyltransferase
MMDVFAALVCAVSFTERTWRYRQVAYFFRRPLPELQRPPRLVSILQPILSGDPTLPACLEENLQTQTAFPVEFHWLIDDNDEEAERICADLRLRYPERAIHVHHCPSADGRTNPKTVKLIRGAAAANGDVLCVLDDDTVLPDFGLETCLPYLDVPDVGLAFGLPYYRHFGNIWSGLVSCFVNATSLLTYIPYTVLTEPFTINGMFYAVRRDVLDSVGGFVGLESILADDFAVAQRFRQHGWRLAQTPLRHGIRTHVRDARHYNSLMRRWFVFPRESLLRHLRARDKAILLLLGVVTNLVPIAAIAFTIAFPSVLGTLMVVAMLLFSMLVTTQVNWAYLHNATPDPWLPVTLAMQLLFPLQMLAALFLPNPRIQWRGHTMESERGGTFRFVRRRDEITPP